MLRLLNLLNLLIRTHFEITFFQDIDIDDSDEEGKIQVTAA